MEIRGTDVSSSVKDGGNEAVFFPYTRTTGFCINSLYNCGFILEYLSQFVQ